MNEANNYFYADALQFNSFHAGGWMKGELDGGLSYELSAANGGRGYKGNGGNGYSLWARMQYTMDEGSSLIGDGKLLVGLDLGFL